MRRALVVACCLLVGCATAAVPDWETGDRYVGEHIDTALRDYGTPKVIVERKDAPGHIYTWYRTRTVHPQGQSAAGGGVGMGGTGDEGAASARGSSIGLSPYHETVTETLEITTDGDGTILDTHLQQQ